ncbi:isopenicillin N synthase family dioxygenase [Geothrix edaphica]|uniref:2-oxoglutarate-dependent ethylene/succinate-forming enzyme n=1 Tax=Geothrix edaphica TaxID=2927976 RepID=A0ABQ5PY04_9BACT|nr:2-oxoglutarate and iron-dependent oxygenase domain-containing protein [Geothrix edaphica]GLH67345.1 oxidoreductase [Geothrix edaphica]
MPSPSFQVETVHLSQFRQGSPKERAEFIRVLGDSFRHTGFVKVAGHAVRQADVDGAYASARAFFALPEAVKRRYLVPGSGGARGFTPFGSEHAKDNPVGDLKEFWHVGQELPAGHPLKPAYGDNLWPEAEVPDFKAHTLALYRALEDCAGTLLEALALYLGLPERSLADMIVDGNSILRIIHYPALRDRYLEGGVRSSAHEDINLITLLPAATDSGLQLRDRSGAWHAVDGLAGEIVADAGDMLSRHVNLKIPSTTHRVVNPASPEAVRYSMPFFCHPRPEVVLDCPEALLGAGETRRFEPITAHAFLMQRLREIGLI